MDRNLSTFTIPGETSITKQIMVLHPLLVAALTLLLLAIPLPTHGASIICAQNLYGSPLLSDAIALGRTLPFVKSDPEHQMDAVRIFAEPAFFTPKFQGLLNRWNTPMVQLPRVWRYSGSSCTLRLSVITLPVFFFFFLQKLDPSGVCC